MEENRSIRWHPGFYAGLGFELRKYRDVLNFDAEHVLSKEPVKMDLLIIKKVKDLIIENPIGEIFRQYNVIEYKSPEDSITIDDFYKTIGYACLYKGYGKTVNAIDAAELTISLFRHMYPGKLFDDLKNVGAMIEVKYPGVYYISGIINIPIQIIAVSELDDESFSALRVLTRNAKEKDVKRFISESIDIDSVMDKQDVDAVLQVSVSANTDLYEKIRRETTMCEALRELMKDEIQADVDKAVEEAVEKAVDKTERETRIKTRFEDGMSIDQIAKKSNVSIEVVNAVLRDCGMLQ